MTTLQEPSAMEPLAHTFGQRHGFPLGVEEELLIVDAASGALRSDSEHIVATARPAIGKLTCEIFAGELELVTPVSQSVNEALAALESLHTAAFEVGACLIGTGLHPTADFTDAAILGSPRYAQVSDALKGLLRTPPASVHVHVAMPDPDTAIRTANAMRHHLPLLHSLAANSPFWYGRDSGLASARAAVLRSYPRYGVPPSFRDWEEFSTVARELADTAGVPDYTYFWWDVRPHPHLGTIEIRAPDTQPTLARTGVLAALIHALVRMEVEAEPPAGHSRDALEEACYQATRYGLDASLPDRHGRQVPARALARDVVRQVRGSARELGCEEQVNDVERILRTGAGADLQRAVHARSGMDGLLRWLIGCRSVEGVPA